MTDDRLVVTLVVTQLGRGGTEKQVRLLATGLRAAGVDAEVLALFAGGRNADLLSALDVPVEVLGWSRRLRRSLVTVRAMASLLAHLRSRRPHVVHVFLFEAYVTVPMIARWAGVPLVVGARRALGDYKLDRRGALLLERLTNRYQDLVVANSEAVALDVVGGERLPADLVRVIPNAIERSTSADEVTLPDPGPHVLCIANLHLYKGHSDLIDAAAQLAARGVHVHLVLVGDGECAESLRRQAERLHVQVTMLGQRDDVPALLAATDVFALASWHEGMSNALMEAVSAGVPVVATDVGGNRGVLGDAGLLCPPRDPAGLADALQRALTDQALRERQSVAGREQARAWTVERLSEAHLDLYRSALAGTTPTRRRRVRH